jgi:predicted metalloprotease
MKWTPGGESDQIEDRRGESGGGGGGLGGFGGGGGGFRIPLPVHMSLGGTIVVLVLYFVFRGFAGGGGGSSGSASPGAAPVADRPTKGIPAGQDPDRKLVEFVSFVVDDVQKTWAQKLSDMGKSYKPAHLVLYTEATSSGCGTAQSSFGPFYCPNDGKVYIDLSFYRELVRRFGAPGDFAQAYVIAHEYGHHIQDLLGIEAKVRQLQEEHPRQQNELSVKLELQADCFAGIWANSTDQRHLLEAGDVDEALGAASAVGDDRLQQQAGRQVNPESFTHGSAAQRSSWFKRGFQAGKLDACDTFSAAQ